MESYSESAQGRGLDMWLLFVRNGACGGGGNRRREGSQRSEVEMQSPHVSLRIRTGVLMCVCLRRRKGAHFMRGRVSLNSFLHAGSAKERLAEG